MKSARSKREPRQWPTCGSARIAGIMYGLPAFNDKMERDIRDGKIVLGGCCIEPDSPAWKSLECGFDIYRSLDDLDLAEIGENNQ